jgi:hypothetical protein
VLAAKSSCRTKKLLKKRHDSDRKIARHKAEERDPTKWPGGRRELRGFKPLGNDVGAKIERNQGDAQSRAEPKDDPRGDSRGCTGYFSGIQRS